ncbi:hypothetical protein VTN96DRAFT_9083 [Rasamsonia emersonii]
MEVPWANGEEDEFWKLGETSQMPETALRVLGRWREAVPGASWRAQAFPRSLRSALSPRPFRVNEHFTSHNDIAPEVDGEWAAYMFHVP